MHISKFVIIAAATTAATALVDSAVRAERPLQPAAAKQPAPPLAETATDRAIARLNECIQERFLDVDERFGYARVIKIGRTPHRFVPETVREMSVVRELERERMRVVLYLAGRQVLDQAAAPRHRAIDESGLVKGPVGVTSPTEALVSETAGERGPSPRDLRDGSRRAFAAFDARESFEFESAGWHVSARPIRATSEVCLQCHDRRDRGGSYFRRPLPAQGAEGVSVRVGDPLGVVMYAYRPAR